MTQLRGEAQALAGSDDGRKMCQGGRRGSCWATRGMLGVGLRGEFFWQVGVLVEFGGGGAVAAAARLFRHPSYLFFTRHIRASLVGG